MAATGSRNAGRTAGFGNRKLRALAIIPPVNRRAAREAAQAKLDLAYAQQEQHAPDAVARAIRWLRNPGGRAVRLPLGIVLVVAGLLGPLLPFVGVQLIPVGLLLIAQDVPPLREPVAQMTLWLERQWVRLRRWRQQRRRSTSR
jgi:hypothetical protein